MSANDISRQLFQPTKHYTGVRMQQGRVILDSDWNESAAIDSEEARRSALDMIGARGAPGRGFSVSAPENPIPGDPIDFALAPGSYYVGGLRFSIDGTEQRFSRQDDWLRVAASTVLPRVPDIDAGSGASGDVALRTDLVYLHGWEQAVSAVEDGEIQETALGGPDTSVRLRRMARAEVMTNVGATCAAAFGELIARERAVGAGDGNVAHGFDEHDSLLQSAARMTVTFSGNGRPDNLCSPGVVDGFLGAENETLRVQLTAPGRFIWGRDNASPLYRVRVRAQAAGDEAPQNTLIEFLNLPNDEFAQPLGGQALELLPWSAQLPNGERVAEMTGHLATVSRSYNPSTRTASIAQPVPQSWLDRQRDLAGPDGDVYMYARLWTGGSGDEAQPSHEIVLGEDTPLGQTGLSVRFSSQGKAGDYWIIAARPSTPHKVVPWDLMDEAPPAGPRRFLAPIALLRWRAGASGVAADVTDCRTRFRPLTDQGGRCTVLVGDGVSSRGHLTSIQEAIDSLPAEGGKVCLLSGTFAQSFEIRGRKNITIEGNGLLTRLVAPANMPRYDGSLSQPVPALIRVADSHDVSLKGFAVAAEGVFGVELVGGAGLGNVTLHNLDVFALGRGTRARPDIMPVSGIHGLGGRHIRIRDCRVLMADLPSPFPAVYAEGVDVELRDNVIVAGTHPDDARPGRFVVDAVLGADRVMASLAVMRRLVDALDLASTPTRAVLPEIASGEVDIPNVAPFGGIQIGGNSSRVVVHNNDILGGSGHGITLGSVRYVRQSVGRNPADEVLGVPGRMLAFAVPTVAVRVPIGLNGGAFFKPEFRLELTPALLTLPGSGVELAPVSGGSLSSVIIRNNRITNHGGSGISTASFSGEPLLEGVGGRSFVGPDLRLDLELSPATVRTAARLSARGPAERVSRADAPPLLAPPVGGDRPTEPVDPSEPDRPRRPTLGEVPGVVVAPPLSGEPGGPSAAADGLGLIAVGDLQIHDNDISANNQLVARAGTNVVHGGIGLEIAIDATIRDNRIVGNGWRRAGAVAGIGVLAGANVSIVGNEIAQTGPLPSTRPSRPGRAADVATDLIATFAVALPPPTIHGGIVLGPILASGNQRGDGVPSSAGTAIRVLNNQVDQPLGKALWIHGALGPVNVEGNTLVTGEDRGRVPATLSSRFASSPGGEFAATGSCVQIASLAADPDDRVMRQFGGEIIFHDNTVSLQRGGAIAVLLLSWDEISAQSNQFRVAGPVVFNVVAQAQRVVQACNNRFRETGATLGQDALTVSLLSIAPAVTALAVGNVAQHCIVSSAETVVQQGNHVENAEQCAGVRASSAARNGVVVWRVTR